MLVTDTMSCISYSALWVCIFPRSFSSGNSSACEVKQQICFIPSSYGTLQLIFHSNKFFFSLFVCFMCNMKKTQLGIHFKFSLVKMSKIEAKYLC